MAGTTEVVEASDVEVDVDVDEWGRVVVVRGSVEVVVASLVVVDELVLVDVGGSVVDVLADEVVVVVPPEVVVVRAAVVGGTRVEVDDALEVVGVVDAVEVPVGRNPLWPDELQAAAKAPRARPNASIDAAIGRRDRRSRRFEGVGLDMRAPPPDGWSGAVGAAVACGLRRPP